MELRAAMNNKKYSRQMKSGIYSIVISLVMVAAVIGFNLIVGLVPETAMKIDTTKQGLYTLSEQTDQVLGELTQDVTIYLIVEPGKEDDYVVNLLGRYEQSSNHIKVQHINPLTNPTFAAKYTDKTVENNGIIAIGNERSKLVQSADMYSYEFDYTYYTNATVFNGESKITGAISYVTDSHIPVVYTLSGHNEAALSNALTDAIATDNMDIKPLDLTSGNGIPEDAAAIAIISPSADISAEEKDQLESYLDAGGNLLLTSSYIDADMTNLYTLMSAYGMEPVPGIIIEGDESHSISGYSFYLLPDIQSHAITDPLVADKADVLLPTAMGIKETDSYRSTLKLTPLLVTSKASYAKPNAFTTNTFDKEAGDIDGPFNIGMASEEVYDGKDIKAVWFGSAMMLEDKADEIVSGSNKDLFVNTLGWMCDKENSITVRSKSTLTSYLAVPTASKNIISTVIMVVLPLGTLAAGVVIFVRRRRRK
jgi:ABC-2 type transport system permease protein